MPTISKVGGGGGVNIMFEKAESEIYSIARKRHKGNREQNNGDYFKIFIFIQLLSFTITQNTKWSHEEIK